MPVTSAWTSSSAYRRSRKLTLAVATARRIGPLRVPSGTRDEFATDEFKQRLELLDPDIVVGAVLDSAERFTTDAGKAGEVRLGEANGKPKLLALDREKCVTGVASAKEG